jgi:hypothetical protein
MEGDIVLKKHELERLGILHMVLAKNESKRGIKNDEYQLSPNKTTLHNNAIAQA